MACYTGGTILSAHQASRPAAARQGTARAKSTTRITTVVLLLSSSMLRFYLPGCWLHPALLADPRSSGTRRLLSRRKNSFRRRQGLLPRFFFIGCDWRTAYPRHGCLALTAVQAALYPRYTVFKYNPGVGV